MVKISEKMNVLFIITDQQRADHLSCSGNPILKTPNLDKLASEGVRFTNAFCTSPYCMPNRATLLTGLYPNVHRVRSNGMRLSEDVPTITQTLVNRGWITAAFGKLHHQFNTLPFRTDYKSTESFNDWVFFPDKSYPVRENFPIPYYGYQEVETVLGHGACLAGHYLDWLEERAPHLAKNMRNRWKDLANFFSIFCEHEIPIELYSTAYVEERTIAFLERHAKGHYGNSPFYIHCSFPDPHQSVFPPGKYRDMYKPEDIELPISFDDLENLRDHKFLAPYINVMPGAILRETNEEEAKKFTAFTYGTIALIDHSIGKILASLDKLGYAENTLVIFTSDHGDFMGDHGLLFKGPAPFNGVLQIPLIVKAPGVTKPAISDSLISSIDLPKTILSLLNIYARKHPPDMQGYNMTPVLEDPKKKIRDSCFIEHDDEVGVIQARVRHLITEDFKLTVYEGLTDFGDIYDRKADPHELRNLWNESNFKDKQFELVNKLLQENLKVQTKYPKRLAGT
ncbi:MAG: sulfatase family protein [Promethearchaeota archaeon]|jgi:arylsulfatase A-like enzyme